MGALLQRDDIEREDVAHLHHALAQIHKRAGDKAGFIEHFYAALKAKRAAPHMRAAFKSTYDQYEAAFSREAFHRAKEAAPEAPVPIFIVGMARSGTTLVEQIVGGGEGVAMGGEIDYFSRVLGPAMERVTRRPFPQHFDALSAQQLTDLARPYTAHLRLIAPTARLVTDKTPANFLFIGALVRLFPNSKVIWMRRDPMDTCFSILQQPFDAAQSNLADVELLAYAYARQERLGRIWESALGDRVLAVRYEDLVKRPEEEARRITGHCGIAWRDDLLDFHKRRSAVHTFSQAQVRAPISAGSVGAWRAYAAELEPLRAALAAEGVSVE